MDLDDLLSFTYRVGLKIWLKVDKDKDKGIEN